MAALIADTSGLLAAFNASEELHARVRAFLQSVRGPIVVSPFALAELDHMVARDMGAAAARDALDEITSVNYELTRFDRADLRAAIGVIDRYPDQQIGLTDASLVVLAARYNTRDILTLDYRHFDVLRHYRRGEPFRLMPRDWDAADA